MKPTFNEVLDYVIRLSEYFKELNQLKEAGIDLEKLAAHKMLYSYFITDIHNKWSIGVATELEMYSKLRSQYKDDNISDEVSTDKDFYQNLLEFYYPENKEPVKEITKPKIVTPATADSCKKDCKCEKPKDSEKSTTKPKTKNTYFVNGKEVDKEIYDKLAREMSEYKTKAKEAFDDIFDDLFGRYFG